MTPPEDRKPPRQGTIHGDRNESRQSRPFGVPVMPAMPPVPRGEFTFEEKTGVGTDAQVFHAVKALHGRLDENEAKAEAAHAALTDKVDALGEEVKEHGKGLSKIVGYIEGQRDEADRRSKSPSSLMRMVRETETTTIAGKIVDDQLKSREWWRTQTAKIIGAAIGGGTVAAILHRMFG